jgi:hypothetical protein
MSTQRPWSKSERSLETPRVAGAIQWILELKETHLFVAEQYGDFRRLTLGLAASLGLPVTIFSIAKSAKASVVVEEVGKALREGGRVLVASESHAELVSEILGAWSEFARDPVHITTVSASGLVLDSNALAGEVATLAGLAPVVPPGSENHLITRIPAAEVSTLEFVGEQASLVKVREIG